MDIRSAESRDIEKCVRLLAALPEYFTQSTHDDARQDLTTSLGWVAIDDRSVVGFVVAPRRFGLAAEITYAAVSPDRRGQGIGTALVHRCLDDLARAGVQMVEVKTLDASANYEPYVSTRAFWERRGFIQIDCIDPLPGWEPGNPSAIYARAVGDTRRGA